MLKTSLFGALQMYLVQLLLPLYDNAGAAMPQDLFRQVKQELVERFGGLTAYTRAPASGLWQEDAVNTVRDDLVIYEVMTSDLDAPWWRAYREKMEQCFAQEAIVVRAHAVQLL